MSNDREEILSKVKKALETPSPEECIKPDFNAHIYSENPNDDDLAVLFAFNLLAIKGSFYFCNNEKEFIENIQSFLEQYDSKNIFIWEKEIQEMLGLFVKHKTEKDDILNATVGITTCESLVARTGSVMVTAAKQSRKISVYPPIHIVIAYASQVVFNIDEAIQRLEDKGQNTSMISLITGPSRTADIEKTLVLGAHGPKELHVFLIDEV